MDVASTIPFQGLAYLITGEVRENAAYSLLGVLRLWRLRRVKQFFTRLEKDIRFSYFWIRCARLVAVGNHPSTYTTPSLDSIQEPTTLITAQYNSEFIPMTES